MKSRQHCPGAAVPGDSSTGGSRPQLTSVPPPYVRFRIRYFSAAGAVPLMVFGMSRSWSLPAMNPKAWPARTSSRSVYPPAAVSGAAGAEGHQNLSRRGRWSLPGLQGKDGAPAPWFRVQHSGIRNAVNRQDGLEKAKPGKADQEAGRRERGPGRQHRAAMPPGARRLWFDHGL